MATYGSRLVNVAVSEQPHLRNGRAPALACCLFCMTCMTATAWYKSLPFRNAMSAIRYEVCVQMGMMVLGW